MLALIIREHPHRTLERWDTGEATQAANIPPGMELLPLYLPSSCPQDIMLWTLF